MLAIDRSSEVSQSKTKSSKALVAIAALFYVYSFLRGIRLPNIWSYSHFLFSYEYGFIKRGIIGECFRLLGQESLLTYEFFAGFSFFTIMLISFLLIRAIKISIYHSGFLIGLASCLYCSSVAIGYLTHTIGYFDHLGLLLVLIVLNLKESLLQVWTASIGSFLCVFAHEAYFLLYFPHILLILAFHRPVFFGLKKKLISLCFIAGIIVTTSFVGQSKATAEQISQLYASAIISGSTEGLRKDAFGVLGRDGKDNFMIMINIGNRKDRFTKSLKVVVPTVFYFIGLLLLLGLKSKFRIGEIGLGLVASLSPLLLHFVAWDLDRFNAMLQTSSFLALLIFSFHTKSVEEGIRVKSRKKVGLMVLNTAIVSILIIKNLFSILPLFDGFHLKNFPFVEHQQFMRDIWEGREVLFPIPKTG